MTIALIANPCAGGGNGFRIIPLVAEALRQNNIDHRIFTNRRTHMAPGAHIHDGWFDGVVVAPRRHLSLLATCPEIFRGAHGKHPAVRIYRAKTADVSTDPPQTLLLDRAIFGSTPTRIDLLHRRARYFA